MSEVITYRKCPVCNSGKLRSELSVTDYTVSHESFEVWECTGCTARFTQDAPSAAAISRYYQSSNYVSHSDTKKGIVNTLYHWVRSFTLGSKRRLVGKHTRKQSGTLLDVGAGTGAFAATMHKAGWTVTGLEPDETARSNAKSQHGIALLPAAALYQQPSDHFDAITLWHVLEHVHDLHGYLESFNRILKPQGTLIIAVPNYTSFDADMYGAHWAAYDVPRHLYHFSPDSMDVLTEQHGMQVVAHKPMWFDSFYVSMLSEQYKNGYTNIFTAFWNGWLSNWEAFSDISKCSSVIYVVRKK
jgi:2-polyprenyl-3-methyl-5-hydroxy-6-metoxy-1,4-benzoquinol methylase